MSTELIINASLPETRIALTEDGEIQELLVERASDKGIVGNIYKGRVTRVLPGMQAAFVDIGLEKAAFLYVDDVFVHSEVWEDEEEEKSSEGSNREQNPDSPRALIDAGAVEGASNAPAAEGGEEPRSGEEAQGEQGQPQEQDLSQVDDEEDEEDEDEDDLDFADDEDEDDEDEDEEDEEPGSGGPVGMGPGPDGGEGDSSGSGGEQPAGTVASPSSESSGSGSSEGQSSGDPGQSASGQGGSGEGRDAGRRRHRRGRRGGRNRRGRGANPNPRNPGWQPGQSKDQPQASPSSAAQTAGEIEGAHAQLTEHYVQGTARTLPSFGEIGLVDANRPGDVSPTNERSLVPQVNNKRADFKQNRSKDRRIRAKTVTRSVGGQVNIQDLLQEGQEVLVQVAKDPISTKGARLTCHISLPGRHLVCMPTIDHVGVSRRIENDTERRKLREFVDRNRPRNLGFIVRTASGKAQSEKRLKQDIDYLARLWDEIREKASTVTAPALVYEDLNSVLRSIRDWVTEEIDKVIVDSRYHHNEIIKFVSHFMPSLKQKVELYHGDIPIFDAYNISSELSRALERKVWLKSGGYIVVDQAEALVAIDVNTGRYVGKKNLEDTILKTNLEAVQEIAYQLRLRNCGGIIILDFIDMEKEENKHRVYRALEDALKKDRARPSILKISELGLVEMTRKRTRDTIIRTLCESCAHCEGKGYIKSKQTVAYEVMREMEREGIERDVGKILVQAHPDVIDILAIDERDTLDQLERRYRKQIYLQAVLDFHPEQFEVSSEKRERERQVKPQREERGRSSGPVQPRQNRNNRNSNQNSEGSEAPAGGPPVLPLPRAVSQDSDAQGAPSPASGESGEEPGSQSMGAEGGLMPEGGGPRNEEDYSEEDRLAFLRAQAAQDAALASLTAAGKAGAATTPTRNQFGRGAGGKGGGGGAKGFGGGTRDAAGGGKRRGRRGGKNRFGRGKDRGPAPGPTAGGTTRIEPVQAGAKPQAEAKESEAPATPNTDTDHSRTPV